MWASNTANAEVSRHYHWCPCLPASVNFSNVEIIHGCWNATRWTFKVAGRRDEKRLLLFSLSLEAKLFLAAFCVFYCISVVPVAVQLEWFFSCGWPLQEIFSPHWLRSAEEAVLPMRRAVNPSGENNTCCNGRFTAAARVMRVEEKIRWRLYWWHHLCRQAGDSDGWFPFTLDMNFLLPWWPESAVCAGRSLFSSRGKAEKAITKVFISNPGQSVFVVTPTQSFARVMTS